MKKEELSWLLAALAAMMIGFVTGCYDPKSQDEFWNESTFNALIKSYGRGYEVLDATFSHGIVSNPGEGMHTSTQYTKPQQRAATWSSGTDSTQCLVERNASLP